jgi:ElaB/YqjD/DUF883 family membrane-anchored ribosome-binding protein
MNAIHNAHVRAYHLHITENLETEAKTLDTHEEVLVKTFSHATADKLAAVRERKEAIFREIRKSLNKLRLLLEEEHQRMKNSNRSFA